MERNTPVLVPWPEVACMRVRNISIGLMAEAAAMRATEPARRGAYVSGICAFIGLEGDVRRKS